MMTPTDQIAKIRHWENDLAKALPAAVGALPEHAHRIAMDIAGWIRIGPDGTPYVIDAAGEKIDHATVDGLIADHRSRYPARFNAPPSSEPATPPALAYGPDTLTGCIMAESAARRAAPSTTTAPTANPYSTATINRTQQALMERDNPEMAARLKAEAHR